MILPQLWIAAVLGAAILPAHLEQGAGTEPAPRNSKAISQLQKELREFQTLPNELYGYEPEKLLERSFCTQLPQVTLGASNSQCPAPAAQKW